MNNFESTIINIYGNVGKRWLDNLPKMVEVIKVKYGLSDLTPVFNLSHSYVLRGFQGNQSIILKLGLDIDNLKLEAAALKVFAKFGAVKLIIEENGLLLLERAVPGISLKSYFPTKDREAIGIASMAMQRLHQASIPSTHTFPHIRDWLNCLANDWNIPTIYLQKARQLVDILLKTTTEEVLLHGDLHHDNILANSTEYEHRAQIGTNHKQNWVLIDPKCVIGERAYEVAAFIRNPIPELLTLENCQNIIADRISSFSDILKLPRKRILDWCFVQAVLAWAWALEDKCDIKYFKRLTKIFNSMLIE